MRSLLAGGGPKPHDGHLIRHRRGEPQTQRRSHVETEAELGGTETETTEMGSPPALMTARGNGRLCGLDAVSWV